VGVCSCFVPYSIDRVHEGIRAATASSWCLWECLGESGGLVGVFLGFSDLGVGAAAFFSEACARNC
jgi:hypothetical protein